MMAPTVCGICACASIAAAKRVKVGGGVCAELIMQALVKNVQIDELSFVPPYGAATAIVLHVVCIAAVGVGRGSVVTYACE